jgi:hypothetical protein
LCFDERELLFWSNFITNRDKKPLIYENVSRISKKMNSNKDKWMLEIYFTENELINEFYWNIVFIISEIIMIN